MAFESLAPYAFVRRRVHGLGRVAIDRPMLVYLDHPLMAQRRLPIKAIRCPGLVNDAPDTGLIAAVPLEPMPCPRRALGPHRAAWPPQPRACDPDLDVLVAAKMPARLFDVLRAHWGLDGRRPQPLTAIAKRLGCSPSRAHAIHRDALKWLRRHPHAVIEAGLEYGLWGSRGRHEELVVGLGPGVANG
jgi:hypothetical protein